ncbi:MULTISPECIES: hypothetical protein [Pseudomonas]|uniref:hypothetical protein n=1 Tax=Pseudomonas TaxID=286 RepID=UPI001FF3D74F|nr:MULTISPECIES: hypothetical protein [Pseudomonas]
MKLNKPSITGVFNIVIFCLALSGLSAAAQAALLDEGSAGGNSCTPASVSGTDRADHPAGDHRQQRGPPDHRRIPSAVAVDETPGAPAHAKK